jgi:RNA polymerase subunit RPABC4/transcription elongation factor Spt4
MKPNKTCVCPSCKKTGVSLAWIGGAGVYRGFCKKCHQLLEAGEHGRVRIKRTYNPNKCSSLEGAR